jgi:hypothetical protein
MDAKGRTMLSRSMVVLTAAAVLGVVTTASAQDRTGSQPGQSSVGSSSLTVQPWFQAPSHTDLFAKPNATLDGSGLMAAVRRSVPKRVLVPQLDRDRSTVVCGLTLIPADPNFDPSIRRGGPERGRKFTMRLVEPEVCRQ